MLPSAWAAVVSSRPGSGGGSRAPSTPTPLASKDWPMTPCGATRRLVSATSRVSDTSRRTFGPEIQSDWWSKLGTALGATVTSHLDILSATRE